MTEYSELDLKNTEQPLVLAAVSECGCGFDALIF